MTFAFSQRPLARLRADHFKGTWKYFDKLCFELPRARAERAALELAIHLRVLDEEQDLAAGCQRRGERFGALVKKDGSTEPLTFKEVTNKIIHSAAFDWDVQVTDRPKLICLPADAERWQRAEIDLVDLAAYCGSLMS
jgi:hypothetical protein